MSGEVPVLLMPLVPPWAAYVIDRDFGRQLELKAREMSSTQPEVSRQLLIAVAQLREAGRAQFQAARAARTAGCGSSGQAWGGNAEVPQTVDGSGSRCPPRSGLTTRDVATRLRISDRQVRNLIGRGLVAHREGRGWVFDEVSVAMEQERRSRQGDQESA